MPGIGGPMMGGEDTVATGLANAPLPNPGGVLNATQVPDPTGSIIGGGILGGVGSLISSGINMFAAKQNRDWQERMANTAHQREVQDLLAAGLNPILSATHGGATTPSGGAGQMSNPFEAVGAGISSAAQAALTKASLANQMRSSAYQVAIQEQQAQGLYLDNMKSRQDLLRNDMVTKGMQQDLDITDEQIKQIQGAREHDTQMKDVYKTLGPWGTFILDKILPTIMGAGQQWLGPSSARQRRGL